MKIEQISENQIKCTLSRSDLASRQIKMSELAYGSEKTRDLFQDMMDQAFEEYGFETDDFPVMIETIPVSMDCIVLMITKVSEPEEMNSSFTNISSWDEMLPPSDELSLPPGTFSELFAPELEKIFKFDDIDSVISLARSVGYAFSGSNSLYTDPSDDSCYLILSSEGCTPGDFALAVNAASEFGSKNPSGYAGSAFIKEHCNLLIKKNALQKLADV